MTYSDNVLGVRVGDVRTDGTWTYVVVDFADGVYTCFVLSNANCSTLDKRLYTWSYGSVYDDVVVARL